MRPSNRSAISTIFLVSLCTWVFGAQSANAADRLVTFKEAPAKWTGKTTCPGKFPATRGLGKSFLHVWNKTCWSCPKGYKRTANPDVAGKSACRKPRVSHTARAKKHRKNARVAQGCPKGQFWDVKGGNGLLGACYSCPKSYRQTIHSVASAKACARTSAARLAKGRKRGKPGCPSGSFRNGLLDRCYQCPAKYKRSLAIGADLTKVKNACFRVIVDLKGLKNPKVRFMGGERGR